MTIDTVDAKETVSPQHRHGFDDDAQYDDNRHDSKQPQTCNTISFYIL